MRAIVMSWRTLQILFHPSNTQFKYLQKLLKLSYEKKALFDPRLSFLSNELISIRNRQNLFPTNIFRSKRGKI